MSDIEMLATLIAKWLDSELKDRGASLNTLAGTVVVLHRLIKKAPLEDKDVLTDGGQLIGGRGNHLQNVLSEYGMPNNFLSDGVTTRSTQKFRALLSAIDYGKTFTGLNES